MLYKDILRFARLLRKRQTPAEVFFWEKVRNRRLFGKKFYRQYIIQHAEIMGKKYFYIVDFHCFENKLIVELDGGIHLQQKEQDQVRQGILEEMGYRVVRFQNEEVLHDWERVEEELKEILVEE